MRQVILLHTCSAGRKGSTVNVPDDFARRLNDSGFGRIVKAEKPTKSAKAEKTAKEGAGA